MPISETGISNRRRAVRNRRHADGLTLIELLVAVTVIGIIVSISLLSVNVLRDDRRLRDEARRISTLLAAAQDEALLQGREFGLELMLDSYRFVEYDPYQTRWLEIVDDDIFRLRQLPDGMQFELRLEGKLVVLQAEAAVIDDPDKPTVSASSKKYAPHIMIFSSGESTPFELRVTQPSQQQALVLQGDVLGTVDLMTTEEHADAMR